jgi:hypothetical protein
MGLDMYAYRLSKAVNIGDAQTDIRIGEALARHLAIKPEEGEDAEDAQRRATEQAKTDGLVDFDFAYWRKFNALHGWMEDLYRAKDGASGSFNCATLLLTEADIDQLEHDCEAGNLRPRAGFFFGAQEISAEDLEDLAAFIVAARAAIAAGDHIIYDSWW